METDILMRALYLGLLIAVLGGWVLAEYRGRTGFALRSAMAWVLIILGGLAAYGLWNDIRPNLLPRQEATGGRVQTDRARDGHFYLTLEVNGTQINFMVDTGASGVVLGRDDVARLDIKTEGLAYLGQAQTANGTVRTARIWLKDVRLSDWEDTDLPAYVTEGEMEGSLLGMDYLNRYRLEIDGDTMVLTRR
ncbi:retropepsin-like aspartic protease family protein [Gemmobacter serpentinus]|uniref:retropepsin-like aspartic protease family protein n=1 Tax=Gemmobacter serpentinus TaxID=2652247 RepID=UPI00124E7CA7|nr:TIGR02281 family clan AA aspartic protease [Gemmobacter serpentinus]